MKMNKLTRAVQPTRIPLGFTLESRLACPDCGGNLIDCSGTTEVANVGAAHSWMLTETAFTCLFGHEVAVCIEQHKHGFYIYWRGEDEAHGQDE